MFFVGMSTTYMLCSHKYNVVIDASPDYDLTFENPIGREAGAFWIQYSGRFVKCISAGTPQPQFSAAELE